MEKKEIVLKQLALIKEEEFYLDLQLSLVDNETIKQQIIFQKSKLEGKRNRLIKEYEEEKNE